MIKLKFSNFLRVFRQKKSYHHVGASPCSHEASFVTVRSLSQELGDAQVLI